MALCPVITTEPKPIVDSLENLTKIIKHLCEEIDGACKFIEHKLATYTQVSKTTPDHLFPAKVFLLTIYEQLQIILDAIFTEDGANNLIANPNCEIRGTWRVVARIMTRVIKDTVETVSILPDIPSPEGLNHYLSRKLKQNSFLSKMVRQLEHLEYSAKCMTRLVMVTVHGEVFDESNIRDFLEASYSHPFWYTFDSDNQKLRNLYDVLKSTLLASYNQNNFFLRTFAQGTSSISAYFSNRNKLAKTSHNHAKEHANIMFVKKIWNFSEYGLPKMFLSIMKPKIKYKEIIIINPERDDYMEFPSVENLRIYLLYNGILPVTIPENMKTAQVKKETLEEIDPQLEDTIKNMEMFRSSFDLQTSNNEEESTLLHLSEDTTTLPIATQCLTDMTNGHPQLNEVLDLDQNIESLMSESTTEYRLPPVLHQEEDPAKLNIVLHFHGGGWVAGSPASHEMYLREWANCTNALVVSVDYSKSPDNKYPQALNECYYVYKRLVEGSFLGISPDKIVLAGDSAGANLAVCVGLKAIENDLRIPDGIIVAYPPLDLTKSSTPSRVFFANDVLLPYYFLEVCLNAYVTEDSDPMLDYYLSPLFAPDELLKKLPDNIVFLCAGFDPLLDDTTRFIRRLDALEKNYRHYVYDLPHGFWNFSQMLPKAKAVVDLVGHILNEIYQNPHHQCT